MTIAIFAQLLDLIKKSNSAGIRALAVRAVERIVIPTAPDIQGVEFLFQVNLFLVSVFKFSDAYPQSHKRQTVLCCPGVQLCLYVCLCVCVSGVCTDGFEV